MMIFFHTVIPREPSVIARELGTGDRSNLVIALACRSGRSKAKQSIFRTVILRAARPKDPLFRSDPFRSVIALACRPRRSAALVIASNAKQSRHCEGGWYTRLKQSHHNPIPFPIT